jgi:hypothetical protein
MNNSRRFALGLATGCVAALAIGVLGFSALRVLWPEYAAAESDKAYNLAMLVSRLSLGGLGTAGAAWIATMITGDSTRAAWWLGGFFFVISLPSHLYYGWSDYPAWYHFVFLGYLIPLAGLTGWAVRACRPTTASRATR